MHGTEARLGWIEATPPRIPTTQVAWVPLVALTLLAAGRAPAQGSAGRQGETVQAAAAVDDTRLAMGKWIETQQILSKERKDWQQGKEILGNRIDLLKKEIASLEGKIEQAEAAAAVASKKRDEIQAENDVLKAVNAGLTESVAGMEADVRRLFVALPEAVRSKVQPLFERIPKPQATVRVSAAERFQNVLGILNEVNKANSEIAVHQEVQTLGDGVRAEVSAIYLGLGQAFYVSAGGSAGIGRPTPEGWKWEPVASIARDVVAAVEILQGKQTPAFVPLPVRIQ